VSDNLNDFALKVASALDAYAARGGDASLNGVPFHFAMVKMAQRLKQRQARDAVKTAFFPGGVALGVLGTLGADAAFKRMAPHLTSFARPAELLSQGALGIYGKGGARGTAELIEAITRSQPLQEAALQMGEAAHGAAMKPWHLGLAGAGGLAAGQFLNRDRGNSGPPMIIA